MTVIYLSAWYHSIAHHKPHFHNCHSQLSKELDLKIGKCVKHWCLFHLPVRSDIKGTLGHARSAFSCEHRLVYMTLPGLKKIQIFIPYSSSKDPKKASKNWKDMPHLKRTKSL